MTYHGTRRFTDDQLDLFEAAAAAEGFDGELDDWIVEILTIYSDDGIVDGRDLRQKENAK